MIQNNELALIQNSYLPFFVSDCQKQLDSRMHSHKYTELVMVTSGNASHILNNKNIEIKRGDIFIIKKGISHQYIKCSKDFTLINICYDAKKMLIWHLDLTDIDNYREILYGEFTLNNSYPFISLGDDEFNELVDIAQKLYRESIGFAICKKFSMFHLFMCFISQLLKIYFKNFPQHIKKFNDMSIIITYINTHYREEISIQQLCKIANMSRANFMHKFNLMTGTSPIQYQIQLKINEALNLLHITDKSISEIAYEVGFQDANYFSRQCKKYCGYSPLKYRKLSE